MALLILQYLALEVMSVPKGAKISLTAEKAVSGDHILAKVDLLCV